MVYNAQHHSDGTTNTKNEKATWILSSDNFKTYLIPMRSSKSTITICYMTDDMVFYSTYMSEIITPMLAVSYKKEPPILPNLWPYSYM